MQSDDDEKSEGVWNVHNLLPHMPGVLLELTTEYLRVAEIATTENPRSQRSACLLLAIRAASILDGLQQVLTPGNADSADLLARSFLEARDLLLTFRFNDQGTRNRIHAWFEALGDGAWKPNHKRCENYLRSIGGGESELDIRWGMLSALSHPTYMASTNSARLVQWRIKNSQAPAPVDLDVKIADYLLSFASLFGLTAGEQPTWISLGLDPHKVKRSVLFSLKAAQVANPILDATRENRLPGDRYKPRPSK